MDYTGPLVALELDLLVFMFTGTCELKICPETRCDDQISKDAQLQHSSLKATVCLQRNNVFRSSVNPS